MKEVIMTAIYQGIADLINAFVKEAKRHGFPIILMIVLCLLFGWRSLTVESGCEKKLQALEQRLDTSNAVWSEALNDARRDWYTCDSLRHVQAVEIAELRVELRYFRKTNTSRIEKN